MHNEELGDTAPIRYRCVRYRNLEIVRKESVLVIGTELSYCFNVPCVSQAVPCFYYPLPVHTISTPWPGDTARLPLGTALDIESSDR